MAAAGSTALRRLVEDIRTAATMPRVGIVLSRGAEHKEAVLTGSGGRHPRYKVIGSKTVGVALRPLDDCADVDDYLSNLS